MLMADRWPSGGSLWRVNRARLAATPPGGEGCVSWRRGAADGPFQKMSLVRSGAPPAGGLSPAGASAGAVVPAADANNQVGMPTEAIHYKRWLLYVLEGNAACVAALKLVVQIESDCAVSNVANIPKSQRPSWLVGVPTLLDLRNKKKYEGSAVLQLLEDTVVSEPLPVNAMNKKYFKLGAEGDTEKDWGAPARAQDYILPDLSKDARYEGKGAVGKDHVEAFQRMRAGGGSDAPKAIMAPPPKKILG